MPRLIWSDAALRDLARLYDFLAEKRPASARRSAKAIRAGALALCEHPQSGRPVGDVSEAIRERVIAFGTGSYVVRYFVSRDEVVVMRIRHGREDGY